MADAGEIGYRTNIPTTPTSSCPTSASSTTNTSTVANIPTATCSNSHDLHVQHLQHQQHHRQHNQCQQQHNSTCYPPQHHIFSQHHQLHGGSNGFHPNAWGQTAAPYLPSYCDEDTLAAPGPTDDEAEGQKCGRRRYEESARSFSAAAAVAAVAAAAYIKSSSAVAASTAAAACLPATRHPAAASRYLYDNEAIGNGQMERPRTYRPLFWLPDGSAYGSLPAFGSQSSKASMIGQQPEAHSTAVHSLAGLGDLSTDPLTHPRSFAFSYDRSTQPSQPYAEENCQPNPIPCLCEETSASSSGGVLSASGGTSSGRQSKAEKPPTHVKKPLNAFMLFMKEMRAKVVAECTMKESAAINQILGRKWHALPREEQAKFYDMARKEKELHQRMYPGWSARDNYAYHAKRRKNRYRYHNFDTNGPVPSVSTSECYATGLPPQPPPIQRQVSPSFGQLNMNMNKPSPLLKTDSPMEMMTGGVAYCRSPFAIGHMPYTNGNPNDNFYDPMDKGGKPYFGLMETSHRPQQPPPTPLQQGCGLSTHSGTPNEPMARLHESPDILQQQAMHSQRFWVPATQKHHPQVDLHYEATDATASSSSSTSPWLHPQHPLDERFQRPRSPPVTDAPPPPPPPEQGGHYSTPPYNPNGSFDYGYPTADHTINYLNPSKTSPHHVNTTDVEHSAKMTRSYEETVKNSSGHRQADGVQHGSEQASSVMIPPMYEFTAATSDTQVIK